MSIAVMAQVWANCPEEDTRLVLMLALADHANEYGESYPGRKALAEKTRRSVRTVARLVSELEAKGELVVIRNAGIKTARGRTNAYLLKKYAVREREGDEVLHDHPDFDGEVAATDLVGGAPRGDTRDTPQAIQGVSSVTPLKGKGCQSHDTRRGVRAVSPVGVSELCHPNHQVNHQSNRQEEETTSPPSLSVLNGSLVHESEPTSLPQRGRGGESAPRRGNTPAGAGYEGTALEGDSEMSTEEQQARALMEALGWDEQTASRPDWRLQAWRVLDALEKRGISVEASVQCARQYADSLAEGGFDAATPEEFYRAVCLGEVSPVEPAEKEEVKMRTRSLVAAAQEDGVRS